MTRKHKQVPLTIYPETEKLLTEAMKGTDNLQASVLREALNIGLKHKLGYSQPDAAKIAKVVFLLLEENALVYCGDEERVIHFIKQAILKTEPSLQQQGDRSLSREEIKQAMREVLEENDKA